MHATTVTNEASTRWFCDTCVRESSDESPGDVRTNNGIGRMFYGRAAECETCGSVVRTLWRVLADVPLIPVGSYRYKDVGPEEHSGFFVQSTSRGFIARRTRTHWNQVMATWLVGLAGAAALGFVIWWFQWRRD